MQILLMNSAQTDCWSHQVKWVFLILPEVLKRLEVKKKKEWCATLLTFMEQYKNHIFHTSNMGFRAKVFNELERFQVFTDY